MVFTGVQVFFSNFFAGVFQPWKGADGFMGWVGCDPYGVVWGLGVDASPGAVTPGYRLASLRDAGSGGLLRIP